MPIRQTGRQTGLAAAVALVSAVGLTSCADSGTSGVPLDVRFVLSRGGKAIECRDVSGVAKVEVTVFNQDGQTKLPRFPQEADCEAGKFVTTEILDGTYVIEVSALGALGADSEAVLFRARREVQVPSESHVEISLEPQVAFFDLAWSFENMGDLSACGDVASIDVFISAGTAATAAFSGSFGCQDTPVSIGKPFAPRMYTVQLVASSQDGSPLFTLTETRLFQRGDNSFHAILEPSGGRLILDFEFQVGPTGPITGCDHTEVMVSEVVATVQNVLGGLPTEERVSCMDARPLTLSGARYSKGSMLEIELAADGANRFRSFRSFVMPEGDHELGVLTLDAVSNVTMEFTVTSSSACAVQPIDGFDFIVKGGAGSDVDLEIHLNPDARGAMLEDLPYGTYDVSLVGRQGMTERCWASAVETVDERESTWSGLTL